MSLPKKCKHQPPNGYIRVFTDHVHYNDIPIDQYEELREYPWYEYCDLSSPWFDEEYIKSYVSKYRSKAWVIVYTYADKKKRKFT